ncbi:MAG: hypothetical protein AB2392_17920 [Neobacillus sp.]
MQVISLSSLIEAANNNEVDVFHYLSSFYCLNNKDVESFLHKNAIPNEKRALTRTSLIIDENNNNEIIGYFTLLIKSFDLTNEVSNESRKKLTGNKNATVFNTILIAQLGRSDQYKVRVSGDIVLHFALENCMLIYHLAGLRIVCVEYDDIPYLNDFYLKNEFKILQVNDSGKILAYIRL